jgi:Dioxygenase
MASAARDRQHERVSSSGFEGLPRLQIPPIEQDQQLRARKQAAGSSGVAGPLLDVSPPFGHKGHHRRSGIWAHGSSWLSVLAIVLGFVCLALAGSWYVNRQRLLTTGSAGTLPSVPSSAWSRFWTSWLGHPLLNVGRAASQTTAGSKWMPTSMKVKEIAKVSNNGPMPATPWTPAGPVFTLNAPDKSERGTICDKPPTGVSMEVDERFCYGPFCLKRTSKPSRDPKTGRLDRLYLEGTLRDSTSGNPIAGASIHLWQADASGKYGSMHKDHDYCRGIIKTDKNGERYMNAF